jgi:shikimate kinase
MIATPTYCPHPEKVPATGCISIIGMAGAGKTTIGRELSVLIGWAQLDADHLIEASYGTPLQAISTSMDKEAFLDIEAEIISLINLRRCIISTGGSAVYRERAMLHLQSLGPVIYIAVPLPEILKRIARKPERGMAMAPGQTIEDLFHERTALYERFATFTVQGGDAPAATYAEEIARWLAEKP